MRKVLGILACVAWAGGCGGGPRAAGGAAKIEATCQVRSDGATCDLVNAGTGAGSRCVKLLLGARKTGSVYESGQVCSGRLAPGGKLAVAARFPQRPATLCGDAAPADGCALHVVDVGDAAAIAAWQKEFAGDGGEAAKPEDCATLAAHVFELRMTEELGYASDDEERENVRRYLEEERPHAIEDWTQSCAEMSSQVAACMRRAARYEDVDPCWDLEAPAP